MTTKPDTAQAIRFLKWLRPSGPWVLTAIPPDGGRTETQTFCDEGEARGWIDARNGRLNLYYMLNPARGPLTKKASKADVEELAFLHVDLDPRKGEDLAAEQARIAEELTDCSPAPSAVVFSGGGYQALFRLQSGDTLFLGGDANRIRDAEAYNRGLERALGGDACHNVDRILRLPGTINIPSAKKRAAGRAEALATFELIEEKPHSLAAFSAVYEDEKPSGAGGRKVELGEVPRLKDLDELPKAVTPRTRMLIVQGDDPDDPTRYKSKSEVAWAVTCEMVRAGCSNKQIAAVLLDPDLGVSDHPLRQKGDKKVYVARQIERAREEVADAWPMRSVEAAVDWINQRYFALLEGKRITFYRDEGEQLFPMDKDAFSFELAGKDVLLDGSDGGQKRLPAVQVWIRDPRRRYHPGGFVLDPSLPGGGNGRTYNLWRGFAVEPQPGSWQRMQDHILHVLANGNEEHARYITNYAAWCFQNPATPPRVALAFRGGEGVGKGMFAQALLRIFGHHGLHVRSMTQVTGRFNSHLRHCCLLFADEAAATNEKEEGALKGLITEAKLACEAKGKDLIQVDNHVHLVMASNLSWMVPAGKDSRRYAVFNVSACRQGEKAYFKALADEMRDGGLAAMLHDMLALDLSDFSPEHDRPDTTALTEQRTASLRGFEKVWFDALVTGELPPLPSLDQLGGGHMFVPTSQMAEHACRRLRRDDVSLNEVGELFNRFGFQKADRRPRGYIMPPLAEARAKWDELAFPVAWDSATSWAYDPPAERDGDPY